MIVKVYGEDKGSAFFLFGGDVNNSIDLTKDQLKLIFTAISGLYSVGWIDGKHCKTIELTYSLEDINKSIAAYQEKGKPEKELVEGAGYL